MSDRTLGHHIGVQLVDRLDSWQQHRRLPSFVVGVARKYGDDRGGHLAALLTYYGFLSLFPLLLLAVTLLGFALHDNPELRQDLLDSALADFPVVGQQLRRNVSAMGGSGLGLAIGLLGLVWGSLGVAQAAQHTMAEVWGIEQARRPSFVPRLGRSLLILAVLGVAVVVTAGLAAIVALVPSAPAVVVVSTLLLVASNAGFACLSYRVLTPRQIPTRALWRGAIAAGTAWTVLQAVGGLLVARQLRHASALYGTFGVVLGLFFFLYIAAQIVVVAAEVNVVWDRRLFPRSLVTTARSSHGDRLSVQPRVPARASSSSSDP